LASFITCLCALLLSSLLFDVQILQYGRVMRPSLGVVIAPPQALQRIGEKGVLVLDVSTLQQQLVTACCHLRFSRV
jgi:hypothetical protein